MAKFPCNGKRKILISAVTSEERTQPQLMQSRVVQSPTQYTTNAVKSSLQSDAILLETDAFVGKSRCTKAIIDVHYANSRCTTIEHGQHGADTSEGSAISD
jgi:hypothetical protein